MSLSYILKLTAGRKTLTRRLLTDRLDSCFEGMKQKLSLGFINIDHIAVLADLWSSFHRFGHLRGKRELIVASCLIPRFNLSWMPDSSMRDQVTINIKTELASVTKPASTGAAISPAPEDFSFGHQALPAGAQYKLSRYLLVPVDYPLSEMKKFEGLHKLFLKYNTAVPSSASVERLFNIANEVLTKKRHAIHTDRLCSCFQ
ncbi:hypothetical protein HPB50_010019 [Hyalomma asiaticum]|uniref:Uncharacterized protein n=1 Tax=Hyalomma asiaticum TaxID=266040 RepID=A0ACB7TI39_HYAAI|nr:hypothetical protein HPB50_010019 [Hyalomma asiaticum]